MEELLLVYILLTLVIGKRSKVECVEMVPAVAVRRGFEEVICVECCLLHQVRVVRCSVGHSKL